MQKSPSTCVFNPLVIDRPITVKYPDLSSQRRNFEGYVLGCINGNSPRRVVCRSHLDEIYLFVNSEFRSIFAMSEPIKSVSYVPPLNR